MSKQNMVATSFVVTFIAIVLSWFRLQSIEQSVQISKASLNACQRLIAEIETLETQSAEQRNVATANYDPGKNVLDALSRAGITKPSGFGVYNSKPIERADSALPRSSITFPNLSLTIPQVIKFISYIRDSGVRHQVEWVNMTPENSTDDSSPENELWDCQFEISFLVDASK